MIIENHTIPVPSFSGLIGIARRDITPPTGIYTGNWGAATVSTATGIHRPLTLTCLTFQTAAGTSPLVMLAADLGWWKSADDEKFLRHGILETLSLKPEQLMICLSHTHAGPGLCRNDVSKPGGEYIAPYLTQLRKTAVDAINIALANAVSATLSWQYGKCGLATNRDLPETDKDRIVVGFNPDQPADDTLLVGRITDEAHRIIATIVNYACHPTTLAWDNHLISPDYPGAMRELVELKTQAPCMFLQGASGELAPAEQYVGDSSIADKNGSKLGYAVLSTLEAMLPPDTNLSFNKVVESGAPLAVWGRTVAPSSGILKANMVNLELPLKELPLLQTIEQELRDCTDPVLKERIWRKLNVRKSVGNERMARIPLWVWQVGGAFLVGQPNEAYSEFQQQLRWQLAPHAVAVMNVVNGHIGYLPPFELYDNDIYSVWQTPFAAGSLELLIETAAATAQQMIPPQ